MAERESDKEKLRDQLFSVLYQAGVALVGTADLKEVIKGRAVLCSMPLYTEISEKRTVIHLHTYKFWKFFRKPVDKSCNGAIITS